MKNKSKILKVLIISSTFLFTSTSCNFHFDFWNQNENINNKLYDVTLSSSEGGYITSNVKNAKIGDVIRFTLIPNIEGYKVYSLQLNDNEPIKSFNKDENNNSYFETTMVKEGIIAKATFTNKVSLIIDCDENGSIYIENQKELYSIGEKIKVNVKENSGYKLKEFSFNGNNLIRRIYNEDEGTYTFELEINESQAYIQATFSEVLIIKDDNYCFNFIQLEDGSGYSIQIKNNYKFDNLVELHLPSTYNGKPVKEIASDGFSELENLYSIVIPESITTINEDAFYRSGLRKITLSNNLEKIGNGAFCRLINLTSIKIPKKVKEIGISPFIECISLSKIEVDEENEYYDSRNNSNAIIKTSENKLIQGCSSTIIPNTIKIVGEGSFRRIEGLNYIGIPDCVTEIENEAFSGCTFLEKIDLSNNLETIGDNAFFSCAITSLEIPNSVKNIGKMCFSDCGKLKTINLPNTLNKISSHMLSGCVSLESIIIPDSVTVIEGCAFEQCSSLKNIKIPLSVTSIEHEAFSFCESLESINIPKNVKNIGLGILGGATSLKEIIVDKENTIYKSNELNNAIIDIKNNVIIQGTSEGFIPDGVKEIGDFAFEFLTNLTEINIPNSVTKIGDRAFIRTGFSEIIIPGSVKLVMQEAFSECSRLYKVTFKNGIEEIEKNAFAGCSFLRVVIIPKSIKKIDDKAFEYEPWKVNPDIFYEGTKEEYEKVQYYNEHAKVYYYSEEKPSDDDSNLYWYYLNGVPRVW